MKNRITYYSIFTLLAAALSLASCQSIESLRPLDEEPQISNRIEITGTIVKSDNTRVDFVFPEGGGITPTWTYDSENPDNCDKIFGFDDKGGSFELIVNSPEVDGAVSFSVTEGSSYAPENGTTVYAIYYPGKGIGDLIMENEIPTGLAIDLSSQNGILDKRAPALMLATGTVSGGKLDLEFHNQTAIIGLKTITVGAGEQLKTNSDIHKVTISGVATEGIISVVDYKLTLTANNNNGSIIASPDEGTNWTTDSNGQINFTDSNHYTTPLCFVVLPFENSNPLVTAECNNVSYTHSAGLGKKDIRVNYYYSMNRVLNLSGDAVASTTIGNQTTNYTTIDAAWAAANAETAPCTVKLLEDCTAAAQLTLDNTGSGAVTLDLNGCNLSTAYQIRINNGRSLSVTDESSSAIEAQGAITSSCTNHALYVNASTLNFSGGTLSNPGVEKYPLYLYGASTATISGGLITADSNSTVYIASSSNVTVTAGSVTNTSPSTSHRVFLSYGQLTISGGIFTSNGGAVINSIGASGRADVEGGYFTRLSDGEIFIINSSNNVNGKCYVYGGCMNKPVNSNRTAYHNGTSALQRSNRLNPDATTNVAYPFQVGDFYRYYQTQIGSTTYRHSTLSSAAKHASISTSDITISPTGNRTGVDAVTLNNENGHTITLDLNNYSLSTSNSPLITTSSKLIVTDSSADKGGIIKTSSTYIVSVTGTSADVTISNCTFESTNSSTTRDTYTYPAVVYIYDSNTTGRTASKVTISSAKIYTANALTAVSNRNGNLEITDSEISSGVTGTGLVGVSTGNNVTGHTDDAPITIINSGSFYCSNTQGTRPAVYLYGSASSVTIHGGYFYSEGTRSIRASSPDLFVNITVNGGYYNKVVDYTSSGSTVSPTYGAGLSCQSISPEVTYEYSQKGRLSFGYQVMATPSQSNASASPASYGQPRTGVVNFTNR